MILACFYWCCRFVLILVFLLISMCLTVSRHSLLLLFVKFKKNKGEIRNPWKSPLPGTFGQVTHQVVPSRNLLRLLGWPPNLLTKVLCNREFQFLSGNAFSVPIGKPLPDSGLRNPLRHVVGNTGTGVRFRRHVWTGGTGSTSEGCSMHA